MEMKSEPSPEIAVEVSSLLKISKDGSVERLVGTATVPPGPSADGLVVSKDVTLDSNTGLFVRLYKPLCVEKGTQGQGPKIPVVVYIHGGGFCIETAVSPLYHSYLNLLANECKVLCVSVNYRRAPEHRLPTAYDDCFSVLEWIDAHGGAEAGEGLDPWIESHADLGKCFVAGDSAGGNIVHQTGMKASGKNWRHLHLEGAIVIHPFFSGEEAIACERADVAEAQGIVKMSDEIWKIALPDGADKDHPFCNPDGPRSPSLATLPYCRIIVFVAEKDFLKDRGVMYYEALKKAGKDVELVVAQSEGHVFHLINPQSENAVTMLNQIYNFIHSSLSL
uniref:TSA: Wollemia nobilis Ref_Wollemi_Transcript_13981_1147 transcribed RNA sequence n=1 Tax=Wollemia nobilis TaxID=56998 RepID=A0A0C9QQC2_9CONI